MCSNKIMAFEFLHVFPFEIFMKRKLILYTFFIFAVIAAIIVIDVDENMKIFSVVFFSANKKININFYDYFYKAKPLVIRKKKKLVENSTDIFLIERK